MNRFHYLSISLTAFSLLVFRLSTPTDSAEAGNEEQTTEAYRVEIQEPKPADRFTETESDIFPLERRVHLTSGGPR